MPYKLSIDVGRTFVSLILLRDDTGQLAFGKTGRERSELTADVAAGLTSLLTRTELSMADVATVIYGTSAEPPATGGGLPAGLNERLAELGFGGRVLLMTACGRLTTPEAARNMPAQLLEAATAGGAMAGVFMSKLTGHRDLLTFDMGGSMTSVSSIMNHRPAITYTHVAAESGPARIPVIDGVTILLGGNSLVRLTDEGELLIGPDSAAADPGPACYGRGGEQPTVTDANLILGYLDEAFFLGGALPLSREAARQAIEVHIARPLGISVETAALRIYGRVNEQLAEAVRTYVAQQDRAIRDYSLLAFGGAGPLHAFDVGRLLGLAEVILPTGGGVTSALGFLASPVADERSRDYVSRLEALDWSRLNDLFGTMEAEGFAFLKQTAGINPPEASVTRLAHMRLAGEEAEVTIAVPNGKLTALSLPAIDAAFREKYARQVGPVGADAEVEALLWRVVISGPPVLFNPKRVDAASKYTIGGKDFSALKGYRPVLFMGDDVTSSCPLYDRYRIRPNDCLSGPVISEEIETTALVGRRAYARMDEHRNLIIRLR